MIANYHTHTKRCRHASGSDREYVESAIKAGVDVLGFSDHAPYLFKNKNYYSSYRMFIDQIEDYRDSVLALKKEYEKDIRILFGFELEYYKETHKEEMAFLSKYNPEYIILGQHYVRSETLSNYAMFDQDEEFLKDYVNECIEGIKTGDFIYLAHPDICGYNFDKNVLEQEYTRLLKCCKEYDMPIEINVLGIITNRHYPNAKIFKMAKEIGNKVIIGLDAHSPNQISKHAFELARGIARQAGVEVIEKLDI